MKLQNLLYRLLFSLLAASALLVSASNAMAQDHDNDRACSNASLRGAYGFTLTGNAGTAAVALVGRVTWDGIGNAVGSATENIGGAVSHATFTATYKVNSDCTGSKTFTFTGGLVPMADFDFVITEGGNEIQVIGTDPGLTLTARATRIANGRDRD
jgi:hypothetical protein